MVKYLYPYVTGYKNIKNHLLLITVANRSEKYFYIRIDMTGIICSKWNPLLIHGIVA